MAVLMTGYRCRFCYFLCSIISSTEKKSRWEIKRVCFVGVLKKEPKKIVSCVCQRLFEWRRFLSTQNRTGRELKKRASRSIVITWFDCQRRRDILEDEEAGHSIALDCFFRPCFCCWFRRRWVSINNTFSSRDSWCNSHSLLNSSFTSRGSPPLFLRTLRWRDCLQREMGKIKGQQIRFSGL